MERRIPERTGAVWRRSLGTVNGKRPPGQGPAAASFEGKPATARACALAAQGLFAAATINAR
jgi:hypothetical protein